MTTSLGWKAAFLFILAAGIPAGVYHAMNDRWGNAIMAAGAVAAAAVLYITARRSDAAEPPPPLPTRETNQEPRPHQQRPFIAPARGVLSEKLNGAILAGFAAAVVVTLGLIHGYLLAAMLDARDGNQIERWLYGLTQNSLTEGVFDIPVIAIVLNLAAGLAWAFVYVFFFEQRLSGPGWRKGILFSLIPWLLSLVVFFPLVGAGFFGMDLDAGPLPIVGNLVLHIIYGVTLGTICAIPEVTPTEDTVDDARIARWENDGIAIGLLVGLLVGVSAGGALSMFINAENFSDTGILLSGGALGCAIGGWIGAFAGLGMAEKREWF